ncbi:MAG: hypothetical protein P4L53_28050 [Candidatus Obscuribacterales bacterium]|nr:hypothetical protein [Candidatus Obscuribacterales bacterium]
MRLAQHSITLHGDIQSAWAKLLDWQNMLDWDEFISSIHFENPIRVGSTGTLTVKDNQVFKLRITQVEHLHDYTDEFSILGTRFIFYHRLTQQSSNQLELYFSIDCEGVLSLFMPLFLAKKFDAQLQATMSKFKTQIEAQSSH